MYPIDGSSPRVRGTVLPTAFTGPDQRFIPACAGNRNEGDPLVPPWPVHPRVCGEQPPRSPDRPSTDGSSPRVRGTVWELSPPRPHRRFIPACAGNRSRDRLHRTP